MGRPGLLDFHTAAEDGKVDVLLIYSLTRLGRDTDKVIKYWHLLRDLGVSIHTANSDEVDMSVAIILCEIIMQICQFLSPNYPKVQKSNCLFQLIAALLLINLVCSIFIWLLIIRQLHSRH